MRRTLVVAPFLDSRGLAAVTGPASGGGHVLVSRPESLARQAAGSLDDFEAVKVLDDTAEAELEAAARADEEEAGLDRTLDGVLRGLHAKLYVAEAGWDARVWVGSANGTEAALRRNVEFMVELVGRSSRCGIERLLRGPADGVPGLGDLLVDYEPAEVEVDEVAEALEREAERLQTHLAEQRFAAHVEGPDGDGRFSLTLARAGRKGLDLPPDASLKAWLVTQAPSHARPVGGPHAERLARLEGLELEQLTSFVAFELELRRAGRRHVSRFVLNVPLRGAPRGRHDAVLRSLLRDKERVLRYLMMILAEAEGGDSLAAMDVVATAGLGGGDGAGRPQLDLPVLEALVRVAARDPKKLAEIQRLVAVLGDDERREKLLPDGFTQVWEPIWAAARSGR